MEREEEEERLVKEDEEVWRTTVGFTYHPKAPRGAEGARARRAMWGHRPLLELSGEGKIGAGLLRHPLVASFAGSNSPAGPGE